MEQYPNRWFYVADVSRELRAIKNTVSKSLSRLENSRLTIKRDMVRNRFRYMYKPSFRISTEILQEDTWRGVTPKEFFLYDRLTDYQKERLVYLENFFDTRKPLLAHGIRIYGDYNFVTGKRGAGSERFIFNEREGKFIYTVDSIEIRLHSTSYDPMDWLELKEYFNWVSTMNQSGFFTHSDRERNRGSAKNFGVTQIEVNQDSPLFELTDQFIALEVIKGGWGRLELVSYNKRTKLGEMLRREKRIARQGKGRFSFHEAVNSMLDYGDQLYTHSESRQLRENMTQIMTTNNATVTEMMIEVRKLADKNTDISTIIDRLPYVFSQNSDIMKRQTEILGNVVGNQNIINVDTEETRYLVEEILRRNSLTVTESGKKPTPSVTPLSPDVYEVYRQFEAPSAVADVAKAMNKGYKYVWNRLRTLREMGLIRKSSDNIPKEYEWT